MARQRFIHPSIWKDETFGKAPTDEQVFFIGCFSNADDEGRLLADPGRLKIELFPYRRISEDRVRDLRDRAVTRFRNLVLYQDDAHDYLAFLNWADWQKPKYPTPSKLPSPPISVLQHRFPQASPNGGETLPQHSPTGWVG